MKEIGFLFPGQGAQAVGMGKKFYEVSSEARSVFDQANHILGVSLTKLCFEGPENELARTFNAQTALFVTGLAILESLRAQFPQLKPKLACGLSLGEFTALIALDAITFEDGLKLVGRRGELMEEAARKTQGTMVSLLGFSIEDCALVCKETGAEIANLNSPEQIVISGSLEAVNRASELAKTRGAKRVTPLKVGGAFHSSLMGHAKAGLEAALKQVKIREPRGIFIPNVTGTPVSNPEEIRTLLGQQLTSPVQWIKTMETVGRLGVKDLLEIGPGRVLKGLARKINQELTVTAIEKPADWDEFKPILVTSL
ncbi:MAG: ACP S-malonyltransferase [Candidatus Omnitrophica bacterium]|nr:ACP S-malonyltransferase [Candidatus Omnitrophota bacterium]